MFRSKVQWVELGESQPNIFFNLEKANYEKKLVPEVKLQNEEVISNPVHVNKEIENFYSPMYTSTINGENDDQSSQLNKSFEDFIESALNIPKLGDEEQQSL